MHHEIKCAGVQKHDFFFFFEPGASALRKALVLG